ncbi:unnamed protein product [Closterium sp. NIES-53]
MPPSLPRAALPCWLRAALPCPRAALLAARRPALPAHRPAACRTAMPCLRAALLAARRISLPAPRPVACRTALPCPCATLLAAALSCPGRPIQFDTWLDDLHLYLLSNSGDSVSLFDHMPGAFLAHRGTADSATRSQWLTHDAADRLAICNHLPLAERAHFGQHKTAKALYDVVVARYSSPATAALGRLILPYLFPELSAFATAEDLITHLCTSDTRYRAALKAEFLDKNPPLIYITLCFIVTRLPDSLCAVMDDFLTLDPTDLTVNLLEKHLLVAETSIVTVGAARGTPRTPFFEGCSPSPLAPSYAFATAVDILNTEEVGAASAPSGKRRSDKRKGGKSGGGGSEGGGGGGGGGSEGGGGGGGGSGGSGGGGGGGSESGGGGSGGGRGGAVQRGGSCGGHRQQQQHLSETPTSQQLLIEAAALGASESSLPVTTPAEALHTFTLDSGASRCFFRDSATLTPLPAPVPVRLADPSGGPVLARSTIVLPCPAVSSGSLSSLHLPLFSTNLVSASGQVATPCSYRLLSHQTLLRHHRLGHPSLPRLHVSSLPKSLPPLPPSPALPCLPRVEGRQRATPHSSFSPTTAPMRTLHMVVWGPTRVSGQGRERYFLLVVDDSTRYTTFFPLRNKDEVPDVLIPWIRAVRLQLCERFRKDLLVLCLHAERGGEFSDHLREFCRGEGILQSFTLPASPQKNGIAECHIGLVMEVARTSMIHAAAPRFLWPFAVRYGAHPLNLWPHVSLP